MSILAEKIKDSLLTCAICEDLYTDPRTLSCLHSFCLVCLRRWAENLRLENSVRCPACRHVTQFGSSGVTGGVNALPKSFLLENLRETVETWEGSDVRRCTRCEAKAVCRSCEELLCEHCVTEHRTDPKSQCHKVIRLSEEALNTDDRLDVDSDGATSPERRGEGVRWNIFRRSRSYDRAKIKSMFIRRSTSADRQAAVRRVVSPTLDASARSYGDRMSLGSTAVAPPTSSVNHSIPSVTLAASPTRIPIYSSHVIPDIAGPTPRDLIHSNQPATDSINPFLYPNPTASIDLTRSPTRARRSLPHPSPTTSQWSYLARPQLKHTIRGNPSRPVWGVATLGRKIYVVTYCTPSVDIYDMITYGAIGSISVDGLKDPWDLAACAAHNCLFVCDWRNRAVFSVRLPHRSDTTSLTGTAQKWLQLEHHPRGLSVSADGSTLLVICANWRGDVTYESLRIYDASAVKRPRLLKKVRLAGFDSVWQAVPMTSSRAGGNNTEEAGQGEGYVVCYGGRLDRIHQVCRVDTQGRVKVRYGSEIGCGREQLNIPSSLSMDCLGQVLVADYNNSRVQLLNAGSLRLQRRLLQRADGVEKPRRLCLNEEKGDLYVGQDNGDVKIYAVCTPRPSATAQ